MRLEVTPTLNLLHHVLLLTLSYCLRSHHGPAGSPCPSPCCSKGTQTGGHRLRLPSFRLQGIENHSHEAVTAEPLECCVVTFADSKEVDFTGKSFIVFCQNVSFFKKILLAVLFCFFNWQVPKSCQYKVALWRKLNTVVFFLSPGVPWSWTTLITEKPFLVFLHRCPFAERINESEYLEMKDLVSFPSSLIL